MNDNTNQVLKVKVARVAIGNVAIEGLLDLGSPERKPRFLVGFPQICSQFNIPPNHASRDFKALLGEGFKISICRYENTKGNNFKALNLSDYELLVMKLDRVKNNQKAKDFRDLLVGLSLHQLLCDGFKIAFDEEDRQEWLIARQESKTLFWELTTAIKVTRDAAGKETKFFHYSNAMDTINRGLFGKPAKQIREELGIPNGALNRDHFNPRALRWITQTQESAARWVYAGLTPVDAIKKVIDDNRYPTPIDFRK